MKKSSKIFVAGGTGMVGSAIIRCLLTHGYTNLISNYHKRKVLVSNLQPHVKYVHLDLERQADVEAFFEKERPEYVFLSAAKVGGIYANNTYPADFIYNNLIIEANVIHAAYEYGVKKLLFLGSSCIYPKFAPQPMKEEHLLTGPLEPTNEPYAIAKIAGIKMCEAYNRQYGTNFISVMPTNLYGPNDNYDLMDSHVLPALVRKFHLAKLLRDERYEDIKKDFIRYGNAETRHPNLKLRINKNSSWQDVETFLGQYGIFALNRPDKRKKPERPDEPDKPEKPDKRDRLKKPDRPERPDQPERPKTVVELWGSGQARREFMYSDDLAAACVFLMETTSASDLAPHGFVNIGTGEDITIRELAQMVAEVVGFEGEIRWDTTRPDGTPQKLLDVSKLSRLGWKYKMSLQEGIQLTYEDYLKTSSSR